MSDDKSGHYFRDIFRKSKSSRLNHGHSSGIEVALATRLEEFEAAYRLVYQHYLEKGYISPNPARIYVNRWSTLPETYLIIARKENSVVGTISCTIDSRIGLPLDEISADYLQPFRDQGRIPCEFCSLAVEGDFYNYKSLMNIFRFVLVLACDFLPVTDIVGMVNPRHEFLYKEVLGLEQIGEVKPCPRVKSAPGVALHQKCENFNENSMLQLKDVHFTDSYETLKARMKQDIDCRRRILTNEFFEELFQDYPDLLSPVNP